MNIHLISPKQDLQFENHFPKSQKSMILELPPGQIVYASIVFYIYLINLSSTRKKNRLIVYSFVHISLIDLQDRQEKERLFFLN